jgi:cell division topological specificity factor
MSILNFLFRKKTSSAIVAKERLQIILAHERAINSESNNKSPSWLPQLQQELVEVVAKYININRDDLKINIEKHDNLELLEINVTLPEKDTTNEKTS